MRTKTHLGVTELCSVQQSNGYARSEKAKNEIALDENTSGHVMISLGRISAVVQHDKHWLVVSL